MKVKKEVFDQLVSCLGSSDHSNLEQLATIRGLFGYEFDSLGDRAGRALSWYEDDVSKVFEQLYWAPDEVEFNRRHEKYMSDGVLSDEERKTLRSNLRKRALDDMTLGINVFVQHIKHRNKQLTIIFIDQGYLGDPEYPVYLHGVFKTFEEGIKDLCHRGEFLGD
jgi:hypothetical protein